MNATQRLRILIVDDHAIFRQGIRSLLDDTGEFEVIGECKDGAEALERIADLDPDILLMDVSMPGMNGLELAARLAKLPKRVKILALTAFDDSAYLRELLASGVRGYLLKHAAADDLKNAIRAVARGDTYLDPMVTSQVVQGFVAQKPAPIGTKQAELTPREKVVLIAVARGLTNREIAEELGISTKTVEVHKANFAAKLGLNGRAEVFRYSMEQGWLSPT